jgi:hypothetical protein
MRLDLLPEHMRVSSMAKFAFWNKIYPQLSLFNCTGLGLNSSSKFSVQIDQATVLKALMKPNGE